MSVSSTSYRPATTALLLPAPSGSGIPTRILVVKDEKKTASFIGKALQSEGLAVDVLRDEADDYLCRPFALDELLARVRALGRRSAEATEVVLRVADLTPNPIPGR